GEVLSLVTAVTTELLEESSPFFSVLCQSAVRVSEGAPRDPIEGSHISGQSVEVGIEPSLRGPERISDRGERVEGNEAEACLVSADGAVEVLDLVEIRRPMDAPVPGAAAAEQGNRIADAFASVGEIPDHRVFKSVEMARRAAQVAFAPHALVLGIGE